MVQISAIFAAAALLVSSTGMAFAADVSADQGALAPGKAAGVQKADVFGIPTPIALAGTAVVIGVGVYLLQTDNGGRGSTSSTTTTTP